MMKNPAQTQVYLDSLITEGLTPCIQTALLYQDETAVFTACPDDDPMYMHFCAETRFNIGSVTKIVTGTLIAKLMETGRISPYDNVKKHLPEYPFADNTVMQLLCHTTGTDSFSCDCPRPGYDQPKDTLFSDILHSMKRSCEPDTQSAYFSYGYTLLMEIIERISGMEFAEYAKETLFDPLGMTQTTFDTRILREDTAVMPYDRDTDTYENCMNLRPTGDSGLFTTAADLMKFAAALQNAYHGRKNPVFTPWQAQYLFRECTENRFHRTPAMWRKGSFDHYGFFSDFCSPEACGHTGYSGCMLVMDPTYEISMAILTNSRYLHMDWNNYRLISNHLMGTLSM